MICPKCGFQQDEALECRRCGIIFARFRMSATSPQLMPQAERRVISTRSVVCLLRRFYRILRWASLAGLIVIFFLILRASPPPQILAAPDAAQRAEAEIQQFQSSAQQGREDTLEMDESELNGWLGENLALKHPSKAAPSIPTQESAISLAKKAMAPPLDEDPTLEQVQSSVRDVEVELREDSLRAYAKFDLHGMDLSLELEGRLLVRDGYLRLEATSGKLGSLPLLAGALRGATSRLFDSPENKEKFRMPPYIQDVRIERGQLIITSR